MYTILLLNRRGLTLIDMPEETQGKMLLQTSIHKPHTCRTSGWRWTTSPQLVFERNLWYVHLSRQEVQFADSSSLSSLKPAFFSTEERENILIHLLAMWWMESQFNLSHIMCILANRIWVQVSEILPERWSPPRAFKFRNSSLTGLYFTWEDACDLFMPSIIMQAPNTSAT